MTAKPASVEAQEADTVYAATELVASAESAFGVRPEVMAGALRLAGRDNATRTEAKAAIEAFLRRKV